jgi:SAM-dependent methyltransferase
MTRPNVPDPLHEMNPLGRFSDRAADYVRHRPDYPAPAIDLVLEGLGPAPTLVAADVGAGTGISARQLAERGVSVIAIEPNEAMRAAAEAHPRVEWRDGSAERTGLENECVHLVLCAQAFHWFRVSEALAEFHRIVRPGGRLALAWNTRDESDPLTREYFEAIHEVNGEHPAERLPFDSANVSRSGLFSSPRPETMPHSQSFDLAGFIGRALSASYVSKEPVAVERLSALLAACHERHRDARGLVTMRYVTEVWRASRTS